MNKTLLLPVLLAMLILAACGKKERTPEQIYNDQASGVALVLNQFYYTVELSNGEEIYFSGLDDDGDLKDLAFDTDDIKRQMVFGTAFFVDDNGTLLTNRHVVYPEIAKSEVKAYVQKLLKALEAYARLSQASMAEKYEELQQRINSNITFDYDEYLGFYTRESPENEALRQQQKELSDEYDQVQEVIDELKGIDPNDLVISLDVEVGVAYHDTFVTKPEDFKPCVVRRVSDDEDVDLALIQLKDKEKTMPRDAYVFAPPADDGGLFGPSLEEREKLALGQELVLIGYNHGVQLAATQEGIKAQLTTGTISQAPDDERVMYSIPMLQGSSGSPVVNRYGELVAVNFAGLKGTQSFNFGIPLKRVKEFLAK